MSWQSVFGSRPAEGDDQWLSISDLMTGLMVIFLFVAVTYLHPVVSERNQIRDEHGHIQKIVLTWSETELKIVEALEREFEDDLDAWNAVLDRPNLAIRFEAPEVLFDQSKAVLKDTFRLILDDFFPRYLRVLHGFRDAVAEVRIEGHTSSEWSGDVGEDVAYIYNMELSQARTRAVLAFGLSLEGVQELKGWARPLITANGLSSSRVVERDGIEDRELSRRVEFRVRTNAKERIVEILEAIQ